MTEHKCDTPDKCRIQAGASSTTLAYYPPIFDGHDRNVNTGRNTTTTQMRCLVCGKEWSEKKEA